MTYEVVDNFAAGLDTRKSPVTAPAGSLTILKNAMITPGGEIAKRRAFVKIATVSANSFGLAATASRLHVFGRNALPSAPAFTADGTALGGANLLWQLIVPDASPDTAQTDYDVYDGKIYLATVGATPNPAISNTSNQHFYDDNAAVADGNTMIVTEGGGKGYSVRAYQTKIYAANAPGGNGKYLWYSAISRPEIWNASPKIADVVVTNLSRGKPARCTVAAADIGKFKNGQFVMVEGATGVGLVNANGFHRISGVGNPANTFVLDEVDTTAGAAAQTTGVLIDAAPDTGRGYLNLSIQDSGGEVLQGLEVYYNKLAVFMPQSTQVWAVDPDPLKNQYTQLLRGSGTTARRSPLQYGSGDVLFLDSSDIGSPVDPTIRTLLTTKGQAYLNGAVALLEPSIGRFWMCFRDEILCLSYFPGPAITAWSVLTLPFQMQHAVTCNGRIYFRDTANNIYVYGGANGTTYDDSPVEVRMPYINGKKPGHNKTYEAIDLTMTGTWEVRVSYDFNNPESEEVVGTFTASTWNSFRSELQGYASHVSFRFHNTVSGDARLSNFAVHYMIADDEQ
jgi:hypothetical protein